MMIPLINRQRVCVGWALVDSAVGEELASLRWWKNTYGYAVTCRVRGQTTFMHRLILSLEHGDPRFGDHINGNKLDNRVANLRVVTAAENGQNINVIRSRCGIRGVDWDERNQKWRARVRHNGRQVYTARFSELSEAAKAVSEARATYLPFSVESPSLTDEVAA